jgi:hypothetical protein
MVESRIRWRNLILVASLQRAQHGSRAQNSLLLQRRPGAQVNRLQFDLWRLPLCQRINIANLNLSVFDLRRRQYPPIFLAFKRIQARPIVRQVSR